MSVFDSASLHEAVTKALVDEKIPDDKHNAFVLVATTGGGVKAVLTTKINHVWEIDSVVAVSKGKKPEGGIAVRATW